MFLDLSMKLINDKPSFNNIQTHAVLPKLHPRSDTILGNSEKHENVTNYGKNANLPTIKKQETNVEERLIKNRSAKRKIFTWILFNKQLTLYLS